MNSAWGAWGAWGRTAQEDCDRSRAKATGEMGRGLFGSGFLPWHSQEYWVDQAEADCATAARATELLEKQQAAIDAMLAPAGGGGGRGGGGTDTMLYGGLGLLGLVVVGGAVYFFTRDDGRRR